MALDPIVRGCDWDASLLVEPTGGSTPAEVEAALNGATVTAKLYGAGGDLVLTGTGTVASASDRVVAVGFTAASTAAAAAQVGCTLDVRVTTTGGKVRAVQVRELLDVRDTPTGTAS